MQAWGNIVARETNLQQCLHTNNKIAFLAVGEYFPTAAHQNGHAKVLEGASVGIATLLHPQVRHAHDVTAISLGPEQVTVSLKHTHDVVVINVLRQQVSGKLLWVAAAGLAVLVRRASFHL